MRNEITFAYLRPGKYTLRVKGANGDGSWNPVPKELEILILPPGIGPGGLNSCTSYCLYSF
ncbi:MAG: hypothetical protein IPK21_24685 [Haliscomenobacter sp.]|nr:hypothetical protein [Haliscomenobacter sp.]